MSESGLLSTAVIQFPVDRVGRVNEGESKPGIVIHFPQGGRRGLEERRKAAIVSAGGYIDELSRRLRASLAIAAEQPPFNPWRRE